MGGKGAEALGARDSRGMVGRVDTHTLGWLLPAVQARGGGPSGVELMQVPDYPEEDLELL